MVKRLSTLLVGSVLTVACWTAGEQLNGARLGVASGEDPCRQIAIVSVPPSRPYRTVAPFSLTCAEPSRCDQALRRQACAAGADVVLKETVSLTPRVAPTPPLQCKEAQQSWPIVTRTCVLETPDAFEYSIEGRFVSFLPLEEPASGNPEKPGHRGGAGDSAPSHCGGVTAAGRGGKNGSSAKRR